MTSAFIPVYGARTGRPVAPTSTSTSRCALSSPSSSSAFTARRFVGSTTSLRPHVATRHARVTRMVSSGTGTPNSNSEEPITSTTSTTAASNDEIVEMEPVKKNMFGMTPAMANTAYVGFLFFLWYAFNIIFNIMNKKVLNVWSNPWILSTLQLFVGSVLALLRWALVKSSRPNVSWKLLRALFLPTVSHLVGHVSTCISFSYVAVSFSHIVKACEPAFGAVGSAIVLGEVYSPSVYLTLLPIIMGVALSAVTQIQFSWPGFLFAMLSNVAFASRNIFSKLTMGDFKDDKTLTAENLYGVMSVMALLIELPFALLIEGIPTIPSVGLAKLLAASGIFYTLYNTVSFMALGKTGVVTHAVGNILKRASVIIVSIMVFRTPVQLLNGVGMAVALLGTCLYSFAKQRFTQKQKKSASSKAT